MRDFSSQTCRAARALLGWTADDLAREAQVGISTVKRFELGGDARRSSTDGMQAAMERAGVIFIAADSASLNGGPGVRLRSG